MSPAKGSQSAGIAPPDPGRSRVGPEFLNGRVTITIEEAATVLGIGRSACYEAARRGEIPVLRVGRRMLVPVATLRVLLGLPVSPDVQNLGDRETESENDERSRG
jgi:excisionase family DNA binding protein